MKDCGHKQRNEGCTLFINLMNKDGMIVLIVFVDEIFIIGND